MALLIPVTLASGWLSDRFGRKPLLVSTCFLGFVCALPLFWLLYHPPWLLPQLGQLGLVLIIGLYIGTIPAVMAEAAPAEVRCTAVSLGHLFWGDWRRDTARRGLAG